MEHYSGLKIRTYNYKLEAKENLLHPNRSSETEPTNFNRASDHMSELVKQEKPEQAGEIF